MAWSLKTSGVLKRQRLEFPMSSAARLSIGLAGLLVISACFSSTPSPSAGNASSSNRDTSPTPGHEDGLDVPFVSAPPTGLYSELSRRVKKFPLNPRTAEIEFFSFEFQRPSLGREGPSFTDLQGEPSAGAQYLATAQLFREEAVSTAKFELIDQDGQVLQLLHFFKQDNSLENAHFFGSAQIPERPFLVAVSGIGIDGEPYRRVFERLFRPTRRRPAPQIIPNLTPGETRKLATALKAMEEEALAKLDERARKNPDGVIVMPRIEISNMTHQSFASGRGNKLGMLLSYDIRFSTDGDYAHSPHVFPFYQDDDMRGLIDMQVLGEEIDPQPGPPSYATPDIHVDLNTLVKYGSEAWYKGGVVYHFSIKLIPSFVRQNPKETKFCVDEEGFKTNLKSLELWQTMKRDPRPVAYRIFLYPLAWGGETEPFDPPKVYYDGFLKEGSVTCLP